MVQITGWRQFPGHHPGKERWQREDCNLAELRRLRLESEDAKSARICVTDFWRGGACAKKEFQKSAEDSPCVFAPVLIDPK